MVCFIFRLKQKQMTIFSFWVHYCHGLNNFIILPSLKRWWNSSLLSCTPFSLFGLTQGIHTHLISYRSKNQRVGWKTSSWEKNNIGPHANLPSFKSGAWSHQPTPFFFDRSRFWQQYSAFPTGIIMNPRTSPDYWPCCQTKLLPEQDTSLGKMSWKILLK